MTLGKHGARSLDSLARALGLEGELEPAQELFRDLIVPWGEAPLAEPPPWSSDASDDHTPYEFSIAVDRASAELRILVEKRGNPPTLLSNQAEGAALNEALALRFGVSLERLRKVEDLFFPPDPQGAFAIWHAVSFAPGRAPSFKLYLNLRAQGDARAAALAETALGRLGFPDAWPIIAERAMRRGPALDAPMYLSLDLAPHSDARVKLYFRHLQATIDDLERACSAAKRYSRGRVAEFCAALAGEGPYLAKGPITCLSFVESGGDQPVESTLYVPLGAYTPDDRVARDRVVAYLNRHELPVSAYLGPLEAFARRPLEAGAGMHSYASLRWVDGPRVTVYFGPEAYRVDPPRARVTAPVATPPGSAVDLMNHHEATPVTAHPFFARIAREPVALGRLWRLLANFRVGVVHDFPRRLAALTARVDDDRLRCVLAKQLNDELGNGDFSRAHRGLFERMIEGLSAWRPADVSAELTEPGREFGRELERLYVTADPYEGLGARSLTHALPDGS